ncbi:MAG: TonB-dependent receptor plug domain-containing protein, partial [Hyphomicrobiaceae bacterium]
MQPISSQQVLGSNDSARLFSDMAGFSYQTGGGVSALPYLNGLGDDRLKILVNGMSLTASCANHMNPTLSYIDANAVGNISVAAGVTPVSMGGDSIGGTIAVDPPAPVFAEPGQLVTAGGRLTTAYRSNGNGSSATANARAATSDASISYTGTTTKAGNYKDGRGREVDSSLYKSTNHLLSGAGRYENHRFGIDFGWQSIDYQGFVNQFMDMTANDSFSVNAHYKGSFDWGFLEGRIYRQAIRHSMNMLEDKASLGWDMPMET